MLWTASFSYAQNNVRIKLGKANTTNFEVLQNKANGFQIKNSLGDINLIEKNTKGGDFFNLKIDGLTKTFNVGYPELPVLSKLIEVPIGAKVEIKVLSYDEEIVNLNEYGIDYKIMPAQPSVSKSDKPENLKFHFNADVYSTDAFYSNEVARFENSGIMRDKRLGRIEISPIQYNPVENQIIILNNVVVDVKFIDGTKSFDTKKYRSPYFNRSSNFTINQLNNNTKELITYAPVKFVIVSDRMFQETLQPFIEWKKKKGFQVITAYTDEIGYSTTQIYDYLENLYNNVPEGESAPSFVLFVGDVEQVPAFQGTVDPFSEYGEVGHVSDLYYCEYTGDKLPEVYYGRFSASSVEELQPQIIKTLKYEKYELPDPSYLGEALMIAGVDATFASTRGNGTIYYASENYINVSNGVNSYLYYYNDNSGVMASNEAGAASSIISRINSGVGFANYTAHCLPVGWSQPAFETYDINGLENTDKYGLLIGNCCLSNKFDENDCFGELIVREPNKGAVAYIGASNSSIWDEDFWWGVGLTSNISATPTYAETGLGAFDGLFHQNGEDKADWYITQGQIITAGNLAVQASTSVNKTYYWEIYHLMGDPSLMNYIGVPDQITVDMTPQTLLVGMSSLTLNTVPYAYVALSLNGDLLDVVMTNETGVAELTFSELSNVGTLDLVITAQNKQPYIAEIEILPADQPYIIFTEKIVTDATENNNGLADYGENISLDLKLQNLAETGSGFDALNVTATISTDDINVTINNNTASIDQIVAGEQVSISDAYNISINNNVKDQHEVVFNLQIIGSHSDQSYTWNTSFKLMLNAPELFIGELTVDDSETGNNDGILDAGETANIIIEAKNIGHANISNVNGTLSVVSGSECLTINNSSYSINEIMVNGNVNAVFNVTATEGVVTGTPVKLRMDLIGGGDEQYSVATAKTISVGEIPIYLISQGGTINTCFGLFYDSGAESGEYSNNENYKITFKPEAPGSFSRVNFLEFDIEENGTNNCYDYLNIYDGVDENAELIYSGCKTNPPGVLTASNVSGALTFIFKSDYAETRGGWKAEVSCMDKNQITFNVKNGNNPVNTAKIFIDNHSIYTNSDGQVTIGLNDGNYDYNITAEGFEAYSGQVVVSGLDKIIDIALVNAKYDVTFNIKDENNNKLDATVTFNEITKTATNGSVIFSDLSYGLGVSYVVECDGFETVNGSLDITSDIDEIVKMTAQKYPVTFLVKENGNPFTNVFVNVTDQSNSNTQNKLTGSDGKVSFDLSNGSYEYEISATGYNKKSEVITVSNSALDIPVNFGTTGMEDFIEYGISIYPNPNNGIFNIICQEDFNEGIVRIIDMNGRVILSENLKNNSENLIDISSQPNGLYLITLHIDGNVVKGKIIKRK